MENEIKSFDELLEKLKPFKNTIVTELKTKYKIKVKDKIGVGGYIKFDFLKKNKENIDFDTIYRIANKSD